MPRPTYDWDKIRTEYITSDLSLKDISEKYGGQQRLVNTLFQISLKIKQGEKKFVSK